MTPIPEPACDIRAQIAAMLDDGHPKLAVLLVSGNEDLVPDLSPEIQRVDSSGGILLTRDGFCASMIRDGFDDLKMASILGYPEDKALVVERCGGEHVRLARAVQARDGEGSVVTEAFASPEGLDMAIEAMTGHVTRGGYLAILTPTEAIARRIILRAAERANG